MLVDFMCRWVEEYHVDGFRFDLASALCRDPKGNPIAAPPLIEEIAKDPVLSKVLQHLDLPLSFHALLAAFPKCCKYIPYANLMPLS